MISTPPSAPSGENTSVVAHYIHDMSEETGERMTFELLGKNLQDEIARGKFRA